MALVRNGQFQSQQAETFLDSCRDDVVSLAVCLRVQRTKLKLAVLLQTRVIHQKRLGKKVLIVGTPMVKPVKKSEAGIRRNQ